jgi:hypothetical protein
MHGGTAQKNSNDMCCLVNKQDMVTPDLMIELLKRIVDCQKRVGAPGDDVGVIFDKI